ncbi:MAG: DUF6456 domain-containing protein [Pseudomonadota bacterium]|nr:DUF6456 domain-containing protein [Pseudomonadota bacterium]
MPAAEHLRSCRLLTGQALSASGRALRAEDAALYLAHVALGEPLRRLAAASGRHPSTVLRAVRRVEQRRDDPLLDDLLTRIEAVARDPGAPAPLAKESALSASIPTPTRRAAPDQPGRRGVAPVPAPIASAPAAAPDDRALAKEARRILRRLCEPRAFLALARGAQVACVFRKADDALLTLARTPLDMARGFAAREWIMCVHTGASMARYEITSVGRAWLKRTLSEDGVARVRARPGLAPGLAEGMSGGLAGGMAEAPGVFARQHQVPGLRRVEEDGQVRALPVNVGETPLGWLARRKGPDGKPFLTSSEVAAGEMLRELFERAQMGPRVAQDWSRFLTPGAASGARGAGRTPAEGPAEARARVAAALQALGPGLNDAALRACCFLEGLEATERRMGWSARSGKVVLKIALTRLSEHFGFAAAAPEAEARDVAPAPRRARGPAAA